MSDDSIVTSGNSVYSFALAMTLIAVVIEAVGFGFLRRNRKQKETRVKEINIYPIKSCGPMSVKASRVTDTGFSYDRFAQVSDSKGHYLTPRDKANARLFHVNPSIVYEGSSIHLDLTCRSSGLPSFRIEHLNDAIENSATREATPIVGPVVLLQDLGNEVAMWLSKATQIRDCRLTAVGPEYNRIVEMNPNQGEPVPIKDIGEEHQNIPIVSLADEAPFLLTTSASLEDLNSRLKARGKPEVDMQRFRPNIVVEGTLPWEEDSWKLIRIGCVEFQVWQRCGRCTMTIIDRMTLERGPEPLATLSTFRERKNGQRNFGMHMIPVSKTMPSNMVEVGQKIEVLEYDAKRLEEWRRFFSK